MPTKKIEERGEIKADDEWNLDRDTGEGYGHTKACVRADTGFRGSHIGSGNLGGGIIKTKDERLGTFYQSYKSEVAKRKRRILRLRRELAEALLIECVLRAFQEIEGRQDASVQF